MTIVQLSQSELSELETRLRRARRQNQQSLILPLAVVEMLIQGYAPPKEIEELEIEIASLQDEVDQLKEDNEALEANLEELEPKQGEAPWPQRL